MDEDETEVPKYDCLAEDDRRGEPLCWKFAWMQVELAVVTVIVVNIARIVRVVAVFAAIGTTCNVELLIKLIKVEPDLMESLIEVLSSRERVLLALQVPTVALASQDLHLQGFSDVKVAQIWLLNKLWQLLSELVNNSVVFL